jgi:hypothetical protein
MLSGTLPGGVSLEAIPAHLAGGPLSFDLPSQPVTAALQAMPRPRVPPAPPANTCTPGETETWVLAISAALD